MARFPTICPFCDNDMYNNLGVATIQVTATFEIHTDGTIAQMTDPYFEDPTYLNCPECNNDIEALEE